jgi:hypothetical protein
MSYNRELLEKQGSVDTLNNLQYERDNLLCKIIEECKPPYYIKHGLFNYRAILLYFIENFNNDITIDILEPKINIITTTDNLFHLLNIPNKKGYLQKERIHAKMVYNILEFRNYGENSNHFKPKIASIGWVKDPLTNPDFVYDKSVNISKNLKFDFLFVREVGKGTKSQPYMYHLVAIKKRHKSYGYVINSQFPIEKDKRYSYGDRKISRLHEFVKCDKPIFKRENKTIPKCRDNLNIDDLRDRFN